MDVGVQMDKFAHIKELDDGTQLLIIIDPNKSSSLMFMTAAGAGLRTTVVDFVSEEEALLTLEEMTPDRCKTMVNVLKNEGK